MEKLGIEENCRDVRNVSLVTEEDNCSVETGRSGVSVINNEL